MQPHAHIAIVAFVAVTPLPGCAKSTESNKQDLRPPRTDTMSVPGRAAVPNAAPVSHRPVRPSAPKAVAPTPKQSFGTLPEDVGIPVGRRAPDFTALDTSRKPVRLSDLLQRSKVLLFFYRGGW